MLNLNVRRKSGSKTVKAAAQEAPNDYYAVVIQLNHDQEVSEKSKTFFAALYFELTINFGFNFCDRVFYRIDTKQSVATLLNAAVKIISIQQHLTKDDVDRIIKHAFIIPLKFFDDIKTEITK